MKLKGKFGSEISKSFKITAERHNWCCNKDPGEFCFCCFPFAGHNPSIGWDIDNNDALKAKNFKEYIPKLEASTIFTDTLSVSSK